MYKGGCPYPPNFTALLSERVCYSQQIQDIHNPIAIDIRSIFSKPPGNRNQTQNVYNTVLIDIVRIGCAFQIDFTI